jgi:hypothetical protein
MGITSKFSSQTISSDSRADNTDVKQLAEHVRTVHFSLLLLCLALFALAWQEHPNEDKALADADSLANLFLDSDIHARVIADIQTKASDRLRSQLATPQDCLNERYRIVWQDDPQDRRWIRTKATKCWVYQDEPLTSEIEVTTLRLNWNDDNPSTLAQFISFWNHNQQPRIFYAGTSWSYASTRFARQKDDGSWQEGVIQHVDDKSSAGETVIEVDPQSLPSKLGF